MDRDKHGQTRLETSPRLTAQPIDELKLRHLELMDAYVSVLRLVVARENDPSEEERKRLAAAGWVRRYAHAHIRRHLRELAAAYVARISCLADAAEDERAWLARANEDITRLTESLAPWRLRLAGRTAAVLAVIASVSGIVRGVDPPQAVLVVAIALLVGSVIGLVINGLLVLLILRASFLDKRSLLLDSSVYQKEDAVFRAIGTRKHREPLTDFTILEFLALLVGAFLAAALAIAETPSLWGGIYIGLGAGVLAMYVLIALEHRAGKRRSLR